MYLITPDNDVIHPNQTIYLKRHPCVTRFHPTAVTYNRIIPNTFKTVFLTRELKSVAVSRYYFCKKHPQQFHHDLYNKLGFNEGLQHCVGIIAEKYKPWTYWWEGVFAKSKFPCYKVTYENLKADTYNNLKHILQFYGMKPNRQEIRNAIKKYAGRSMTWRKGKTEEWKEPKYKNIDFSALDKPITKEEYDALDYENINNKPLVTE